MIVFVRFNLGPGVPVEVQEESSVLQLKEAVATQQGVQPESLRVLFAGRELHSSASLQSCDLPEQSTVHVVLPPSPAPPPPSSSSSSLLFPQEEEEGQREEAQAAPPTGTLSTFFVYCKSCRSIKPGKLRVRCRNCKQTTVMLSRGPSCWDDVLQPGRIPGTCQSDGCHSNQAEFYMKCAAHPTSDDELSVALDLIMNNSRRIPCIACTDIMDPVLVFSCSDRHVICLDCFRGYCQTRLNERRFVRHPDLGYSLPCAAGCRDSLIRELHHFRVLGEEQYGRYLHYGAEECLLAIGGILCPSPGCGAGLLPPEGERRVTCDFGCGFQFCRDCRGAYHQGACLTVQAPPPGEAAAPPPQGFVVGEEAGLEGRWEAASQQLIRESTKRCPQCSVPVERNGGCMHMQCSRCGADWCWLCRVSWNHDCMGNHWFG